MNVSDAPDPGAFGFGDCLVDPGVLDRDDAIYALCIHHHCPAQCLVLRRAEATLDNAFAPLPLRMRYFDADADSEEAGFADYSDLTAKVLELQAYSAPKDGLRVVTNTVPPEPDVTRCDVDSRSGTAGAGSNYRDPAQAERGIVGEY